MINVTHLIMLSLVSAFWVLIAWAVITLVKTLQRMAGCLEQLVAQNEERLKH